MRVVLCDDNRILCEALTSLLQARGHRVSAIATRASEAVAAVTWHRPDACVLDLRFPDGSGLDAARMMRRCRPDMKILFFSGLADAAVVSEAKKIGVAGFVRKDQKADLIVSALDTIGAGGVAFSPKTPDRFASRTPLSARESLLRSLTRRETQVLRMIVAGQSTEQMAREMGVTTNTLRSYIKNILAKLGVHSRIQAAAMASRTQELADGDEFTGRHGANGPPPGRLGAGIAMMART